jgi:hypothetical protein
MKIDANSIIKSNPGIPSSRLHDDMLAIDEGAGFCYSMNAPAARIWELVATPISVNQVCAALCREFNVDRETCFRDVATILEDMQAANLVRISNAGQDSITPR